MKVNQVAWSALNQSRILEWYQRTFGMKASGGFDLTGPEIAALHDLPVSESRLEWLVDGQKEFQLEFFSFSNPRPKAYPRPLGRVIGYNSVWIAVDDWEQAVGAASNGDDAKGVPTCGKTGNRVALTVDPEGVAVEVFELDPRGPLSEAMRRPAVPSTLCGVSVVVPRLDTALDRWTGDLGLPAFNGSAPTSRFTHLWGIDESGVRSAIVGNEGILIELVEISDPIPASWRQGHDITDQGLLNVAVGTFDFDEYKAQVDSLRDSGWQLNQEFGVEGLGQTTYVVDPEGFSLEVMWTDPSALLKVGYAIPEDFD